MALSASSKKRRGIEVTTTQPTITANTSILDMEYYPPKPEKAEEHANYHMPRKDPKIGKRFDFWRTTTGNFYVY